jgi:hypothetical protein
MRGRHTLAAGGTGLALGLLAIGPGLSPGFVLAYDMVFVPHPVFTRATFGISGMLPRHVPSDAVVTALSHLAPADVVQKAILLSIFVIACVSAAALVPAERLLPRLAAGVVYAWNPFVAERLLLGQWAMLLGYAALPWVALAAARGDPRRLLAALVPAAVGGFAAWALSGLVALVVTAFRDRSTARGAGLRAWLTTPVVLVAVALPWLVPSLLRSSGVPADPAGVAAFAARADTPFGATGSLLLLGGGWNAETVPSGYGHLPMVAAWLCVVAVALACYAGGRRIPGLGAAAAAGFALAALGAVAPGALRAAIGAWPGFAVLRDGQQYVAPLAVVVAAGVGMAVDRLYRPELAALAVFVPLALLPGLAWGGGGRLAAAHYPADWARARALIDAAPGDVLVLPWEAYRGYPWNGGRRVLDPLPRYLPGRVILNDGVRVRAGGARGADAALAAEDPRARALDAVVRSGAPLTGALGARGVRYVAVDAGPPPERTSAADGAGAVAPRVVADQPGGVTSAALAARMAGAERLVAGPDLVLYRIPVTRTEREPQASGRLVAGAWFITFGVFLWSAWLPGSRLLQRSLPKEL